MKSSQQLLSLLLDRDALLRQLQSIDLEERSNFLADSAYRTFFCERPGIEHYRLLAAISMQLSGSVVYDVGTHYGSSALALSFNKLCKVKSYDIEKCRKLKTGPEINITFCLGDFRLDPDLLSSPFILIDVDPHDGIQEKQFHEFFLTNNYQGLVLWDDIKLSEAMRAFWASIGEDVALKVELTEVGHWSGTGLVIYGDGWDFASTLASSSSHH